MTHDPKIVAHLRSALDEVAAKPTVPVTHTAPARRVLDTRRWVAVAASLVIVAGAIVGIAMYRGDSEVASNPSTTTLPAASGPTMPYFLAAADLAPGPVTASTSPWRADIQFALVWARTGSPTALLRLTVTDPSATTATTTTPGPAITVRELDGANLEFSSYGLTDAERTALAQQVVPGSGLPWVLPVDGWQMVAMLTPQDGPSYLQVVGSTLMVFGPRAAWQLFELGATPTTAVTVAGQPGFRSLNPSGDGQTVVVWRDPVSGQWVSLMIPADRADHVDELIAAVRRSPVEVSMNTATSSYALATFDGSTPDPAVGQKFPPIQLSTGELTVDSPTLFVFVAHWCPHCTKEIPLLQRAIDDGSLKGVRVVLVSTAVSASATNYPPVSWLSGLGWTGETVNDTASSDGAPGLMAGYFGTPGFPYLVMVGSDGLVTARASGEMPIADVVALTHNPR